MTLNYIKPAEAVNTFTQIIGQLGAVRLHRRRAERLRRRHHRKHLAHPQAHRPQEGNRQTRLRPRHPLHQGQIFRRHRTRRHAHHPAHRPASHPENRRHPAHRVRSGTRSGRSSQAAGGQPGGGGSGEDIPIQIIPDPRTNRIVAMGRPIDLITVEGLVREFDVETSEKNFLRRKLRFLTVSEFLPIASDALTRAFSGTGDGGGGVAHPRRCRRGCPAGTPDPSRWHQHPPVRQLRSVRQHRSQLRWITAAAAASVVRQLRWWWWWRVERPRAIPTSTQRPSPCSSAAPFSSPTTSPTPSSSKARHPDLEIIERLLDQIDVKPDQVMISTVIGQLTLNDSKEFGSGLPGPQR